MSKSVSDTLDSELAQAALQKRQAGGKLTLAEVRAIQRVDRKRRAAIFAAVDQTELMALTGKSARTLMRWQREGMPRAKDKTYDLAQVWNWVEEHLRTTARPVAEGKSPEWERFRAAKADMAEMQLEKLRGELMPRAEVESGLRARAAALKRGLLGLPRALAPMLAIMTEPREVEAALRANVVDLLRRYAGTNDDGDAEEKHGDERKCDV